MKENTHAMRRHRVQRHNVKCAMLLVKQDSKTAPQARPPRNEAAWRIGK